MKMKKQIIALGFTGIMAMQLISGASASNEMLGVRSQSEITAIREDIPTNEAMLDTTFNSEMSKSSLETLETLSETKSRKWKVWGERLRISGSTSCPIGYSAYLVDGDVESLYHYTRTYLTNGLIKRADSGRVWGNKTVCAVGGECFDELFNEMIHNVKYGIES